MTKIEELEQRMDEIKTLQKDFEIEINECQKALVELKESKKEGKWKPQKQDEEFWYKDVDGHSAFLLFGSGEFGDNVLKNQPVFPTQDECERYWHFMDTVKEKSYEFSKEEWEDWDIYKYYVSYKSDTKDFRVLSNQNYKYLGQIYFKTVEDAQYIIDNFKDELMKYFV